MTRPISTVNHLFLPTLKKVHQSKHSKCVGIVNAQIISRIMGIGIVIFSGIDAIANLGLAAKKSFEYLTVKNKPKKITIVQAKKDEINKYLKASKESITINSRLFVKIARNPCSVFCSEAKEEEVVDWGLEKYIGHIYVINLDDDPGGANPTKYKKRLETIASNLNKIGVKTFERFRATNGYTEMDEDVWSRVDENSYNLSGEELTKLKKGQAGCYMSHYRVIKNAAEKYEQANNDLSDAKGMLKDAGDDEDKCSEANNAMNDAEDKIKEFETILVLEDDNGMGMLEKRSPKTSAKVVLEGSDKLFESVMSELPADWDMVYLCAVELGEDGQGWMKAKSPSYSKHLNKLDYGLLCNAMIINSKAYPTILEGLEKIDDPTEGLRALDHAYGLLHRRMQVFTPKVSLAYQQPGESSITPGSEKEPWNGSWDRQY